MLVASSAAAATRYVAKGGADSGDCTMQSKPCLTIAHGISTMAGGDTLIVGDGTYAETIRDMPSGTAAAYTTIRAANDWGVLIDGSGFSNTFKYGIYVGMKSYVQIRGFHVKMNQANDNNPPIIIDHSDHVKVQRCSASYGPTSNNASSFAAGPASSYVLFEECYAFGGSRYQFLVFQSDHVVVRRCVARSDHWTGTLQCAGFTNYDSTQTAWQNDIVLDSDTANCAGKMFGGFFNENKHFQQETSEAFKGNIVLNVKAYYAGDYDYQVSGTRTIDDMVIWDSSGGYFADVGGGNPPTITTNRVTIGGITGNYDGPNGGGAWGTGYTVYGQLTNTLQNSLFVGNHSFGVADYTSGDYNAFFGNGASYGGHHPATPGAHDVTNVDARAASLKYLPRIEPGSPLKTSGKGGDQMGAEILFKVGATGSLHGDPGWDTVTPDPLWPFPNEDQIRNDMASYSGPGGAGARGFTTGNSIDKTQQTLTKYIWEYLGNQIPPDIYGFNIAVSSLPNAVINKPYSATVSVGGGTTPYSWSISGNLPPGLTLDPATGTVSGTPTMLGDFPFTATVTDSAKPTAQTATKALSIRVTDGTMPMPGDDGGVNVNAAASGSGDSGCGCHAAGVATNGALTIAGLLAAIALLGARRKDRR